MKRDQNRTRMGKANGNGESRLYENVLPLPIGILFAVFVLVAAQYIIPPESFALGDSVLIGHWAFDDATGAVAIDSSGGVGDGKLVNMDAGAAWVDGVVGGGLEFDGVDDYILVEHGSNPEFMEQFSIAFWYRPKGVNPVAESYFIDKSAGVDKCSFILRLNTDNQLELMTSSTGYSDVWKVAATADFLPTPGVWTHVTVVKDGRSATFYQDGVELKDNDVELDTSVFPNDEGLRIGGEGKRSINGAIDEVRLYQGAVTAEEISGLAKAPRLEGLELADVDGLHNIDPNIYTNETKISAVLKGVEGYVQSVQMAEDDRLTVNLHSYWRPPLGDYDGSTSLIFNLLPGDGERDVYVIVTNQAGVSYPPVFAGITLDAKAPSVVMTTDSPDPTGDLPIHVSVAFSEPVYEFTAQDIVIGGVGGSITGFAGVDAEYEFDLTAKDDGKIEVTIAAGCAFDAAGNANISSLPLSRICSKDAQGILRDDFSVAHDYSKGDVLGTIWDGILGLEHVATLDANGTNAGELTIAAGDNAWEAEHDGVLLYKNVPGNFVMEVEVTAFDNPDCHDKGLMARCANLSDAGPGEDYLQLRHFDLYNVGNQTRDVDNSVVRVSRVNPKGVQSFLRMERIADTFYFKTRTVETDPWIDLPDTPIVREDLGGLPLQVGIWQCTHSENLGTVRFDNFMVEVAPENTRNTATVDGVGTLPERYATLSEAYSALNRYDGVGDKIDIVADSLMEDTLLTISGMEDLTISGDADGNGIPCKIVVSGDHPAFNLRMSSGATYTIKDVVILPKFDEGDKECEAVGYSCSGGTDLIGATAVLENVVVSSSNEGNTPVDPTTPYSLESTTWRHAFKTAERTLEKPGEGNAVNVIGCTLAQTSDATVYSDALGLYGTTFNVVDTKILNGRSYGIHIAHFPAGTTVSLTGSVLAGFPFNCISFERGGAESLLQLKRTEFSDSCSGVYFGNNANGSLLHILEGCKFTGMYGTPSVDFHSLSSGETSTLRVEGTVVEPVEFLKNSPHLSAPTMIIAAENNGRYDVVVENAVFLNNAGRGIEFLGNTALGSTASVKNVLFAGNADENVAFLCEGLAADFMDCTFHNDKGANQVNSGKPGNNRLIYTDCIFTGKPAVNGANHIMIEQTGLRIDYVNCALVTEGPDGMFMEYSDYANVAAVVKTDCITADPIYQNVDLESLKNGSFNVRNPVLADVASDGDVLTGWGNAELLVGADKENRLPRFLNDAILKRDAVAAAPYHGCLIGDAYDPDDYDQPYLTFSKVDGPKWLTVMIDGLLAGTPEGSDLGVNIFTVTVKDRLGETDEAVLQIEVVEKGSVIDYVSAVSPAWVEETVPADVQSISAALIDGTTIPVVRESPTRFYVDNASGTVGTDVNNTKSPVSLGLLLSPKEAVELEFETTTAKGDVGGVRQSITWTPSDLTGKNPATDAVAIRRGDSLLLTADGKGSALEIDVDGDGKFETVGSSGDRFPTFYGKPGVYTATARIDGAIAGGMKVLVQDVDLDGPIACEVDYRREKEVSYSLEDGAARVVFVSGDPAALEVDAKTWGADVPTLYVKPLAGGTALLQARLGHKNGPVIAEAKVDVFTVDSSGMTSVSSLAHYPDGSSLLGVRVVMDPLIRDLDIQIHCFGTGATLDDLTTNRHVGTNEFTEKGEFNFGVLMTGRGVCHWVRFYQREIQISRSY